MTGKFAGTEQNTTGAESPAPAMLHGAPACRPRRVVVTQRGTTKNILLQWGPEQTASGFGDGMVVAYLCLIDNRED